MDRPSTSQSRQSIEKVDKVEMYEVREHVPYHAEITRAPGSTNYDAESGLHSEGSWESAWRAICQLVNLFHHMLTAIVTFVLWHFALTQAPNGAITNLHLHIVFAGTGYQLFLVEAILTLHQHNSWSFQLSPDGKRVVHGSLQLIGAVFVIAGTFLGLAQTDMVLSSAHGICGVIALGFAIMSFVSGVVALFSAKVRLMIKSGPVKIFHVAVGLFSVSMGLITIAIGFQMDFFYTDRAALANAMMVFVCLILLYILIQPIVNLVSTTRKSM
ncbi:eukaryotic cytochrome b561 domain-containing protein [Phthorimaea operculella]|nr:eukaryotic cytochrome b561 domain-containing protein [Phthorimaea operculella]